MTEDRRITISCEACGYQGLWGSCYCPITPVPLATEDALAELTRRVERLERAVWPSSNDHEWASVEETANIPRCTCVKWRLPDDSMRRKHNPYCKFPHNGQQGA